jgi:Na+-driven multidrug efflux pump
MAIGGVLAAYIGQNIGNLNKERARESFIKGLQLSLFIMVILSLIMLPVRSYIVTIFYDRGTEAFDLTVRYMFYLVIGLPLMAIFQAFLGAFNGSGKTNYTFIVSVTRLWGLRIPLILLFVHVFTMGPSGIWTAMLISNFIIAFVGYWFYRSLTFEPSAQLDI